MSSVTPRKEIGCNVSHPSTRRILFTDKGRKNHEDSDTFQVFVRVKPNLEATRSSIECIRVEGINKVVCEPPPSTKNKKTEKVEYTFSHILGPKTSQTEIFSKCIVSRIEDLLNSKSSLIFTYGTTNAGKTFTVQGNAENPGIIPQTLNTLFNNIEVHSRLLYKPNLARDVIKMSPKASREEVRVKNDILRSFRTSRKSVQPTLQSAQTNGIVLCDEKPRCGVWVSFLEVYNETINDLLNPGCTSRKIAADPDNNFYVKELKQIYVSTAEEAFMIYQYGKKNLNMASTKLNKNSSRSHCIFTIHLVNLSNKHNPVSKLRICDLAGSERLTKTQNTGLRSKETGSINRSLFDLNRCLRTIRENQTSGVKQLIPYRQSDLTKLLHSALDDRTDEKIIMIVNINPSAELYDETQEALKMCAIASKIKNKPLINTVRRRSKRFISLTRSQPETASVNQDHTPSGNLPELGRVASKHTQDKPCDDKDADILDRWKNIWNFYRTNIISRERSSGNGTFEENNNNDNNDNNNNVTKEKLESHCCLEKTTDVREPTNPEIYLGEGVDKSDTEVIVNNLSAFINKGESRATMGSFQIEAVSQQSEPTCLNKTQEMVYQSQLKKTEMLELRLFRCDFTPCAEVCRSSHGLRQHYYEMHFNELKKRNIYCGVCGRFYSNRMSLCQHTSRHCNLAQLLTKAGSNGPKEYIEFFKKVNNDPKIRLKMLETRHVSVTHPFISNFSAMDEATLLSWVPILEPIQVLNRRRSAVVKDIKRSRQLKIDQYLFRKSWSPEISSGVPERARCMDSEDDNDGVVNDARPDRNCEEILAGPSTSYMNNIFTKSSYA